MSKLRRIQFQPMPKLRVILPAILLLCLVGCGSGRHLQMTAIQLGRSLNSDKTVSGITTVFSPDDSIFLSVLTGGAGSGTIGVKWTYGSRVIDEPKKQVTYNQAAATDFRLQSAGGFPIGEYTAEVFLDGQSIGRRTFHVERPR
jgi:hypothetical protein